MVSAQFSYYISSLQSKQMTNKQRHSLASLRKLRMLARLAKPMHNVFFKLTHMTNLWHSRRHKPRRRTRPEEQLQRETDDSSCTVTWIFCQASTLYPAQSVRVRDHEGARAKLMSRIPLCEMRYMRRDPVLWSLADWQETNSYSYSDLVAIGLPHSLTHGFEMKRIPGSALCAGY